jgi:hypothetical protein
VATLTVNLAVKLAFNYVVLHNTILGDEFPLTG